MTQSQLTQMATHPDCTHCSFFKAGEPGTAVVDWGTCRRHPPTAMMDSDGEVSDRFPIVTNADLCGEWKAKQ